MYALAPTSTPRVGSSISRMSQSAVSHLPMEIFCWLPPERLFTICRGLGVLISRARISSEALSISRRGASRRSRRPASLCQTVMVRLVATVAPGSAPPPSGSRSRSRCRSGAGFRPRSRSGPAPRRCSARHPVFADDRLGQLRAAGAHRPYRPRSPPWPGGQSPEKVARQALHLQHRRSRPPPASRATCCSCSCRSSSR